MTDTEKPEPMGDPLLDLDTLVTRPVIAINGTRYEILHPDELSVIENHRFGRWGALIEKHGREDTEEAERKVEALVGLVARKVSVGVPDEVFSGLSGAHKWAIADLFTALLTRRAIMVAGAMQRASGIAESLSTGARPSPGSSAFSEDSRRTGWIERLRDWFGRT